MRSSYKGEEVEEVKGEKAANGDEMPAKKKELQQEFSKPVLDKVNHRGAGEKRTMFLSSIWWEI